MSKREDAFASFGTKLRNPQWSWPNADRREAVSSWPLVDIVMQLVDFDPELGAHTWEVCPVRNP